MKMLELLNTKEKKMWLTKKILQKYNYIFKSGGFEFKNIEVSSSKYKKEYPVIWKCFGKVYVLSLGKNVLNFMVVGTT